MKTHLYLFIIFSVILFNSCKKETKSNSYSHSIKDQNFERKLHFDSILKLPISTSDYYSWYSQVFESEDESFLFRENGMLTEVQIYDLNDLGEPKKNKFITEGPNGIRDGVGLSIIPVDNDRYFITNRHNELFLMLTDSVLKRYDLSNTYEYPSMMPTNHAKTYMLNDSLFGFGQYKQININTNEYLQSSVFALYDIQKEEFKDASVTFPDSYLDKCWTPQMLFPSYTFNNKLDRLIFSFAAEKNLYIYNYHSDTLEEVNVPFTSYFKKVSSFKECEEIPEKIDSYFLNTPNYISIIYDKYRDIYYRLFFLPPENIQKGMRGSHIHKRLGITVYDSEFNVVYEELFDSYKYYPIDYFVTKEGFWLSMNNPESNNFDESYFQFALLKFR